MMSNKRLILWCFICFWPLLSFAQKPLKDHQQLESKALSALENKDYNNAIHLYQSLIDLDPNEATYLYNIGIAHFHTGEISLANSHFFKTLQLAPSSKEALHNLNLCQAQIANPAQFKPLVLGNNFIGFFPWNYCLIAASILIFAAGVLILRTKNRKLRLLNPIGLLATSGIFLILAVVHYSSYNIKDYKLIAQENTFVYRTAEKASVSFRLGAGILVKVIDQKENMVEIETTKGQKGWIDAKEMEKF